MQSLNNVFQDLLFLRGINSPLLQFLMYVTNIAKGMEAGSDVFLGLEEQHN